MEGKSQIRRTPDEGVCPSPPLSASAQISLESSLRLPRGRLPSEPGKAASLPGAPVSPQPRCRAPRVVRAVLTYLAGTPTQGGRTNPRRSEAGREAEPIRLGKSSKPSSGHGGQRS